MRSRLFCSLTPMRVIFSLLLVCLLSIGFGAQAGSLGSGSAQTVTALPAGQCDLTILSGATACVPTPGTGGITQTSLSLGSACPSPANGCYDAVRILAAGSTTPPRTITPIDVWGACRYLDALSTNSSSLFIPLRSQDEWSAFVNAVTKSPLNQSLSSTTCARPYNQTSVPSPPITSLPAAPSVACTLPLGVSLIVPPATYQRTGTLLPQPSKSIPLSCNGGGTILPAQVFWTAGISSDTANLTGSLPPSADWTLTVNYAPYIGLSASGTLQTQSVSGTSSLSLDPGSSFDLTWTTVPSGSKPVTIQTTVNNSLSPPAPGENLTQNIPTSSQRVGNLDSTFNGINHLYTHRNRHQRSDVRRDSHDLCGSPGSMRCRERSNCVASPQPARRSVRRR